MIFNSKASYILQFEQNAISLQAHKCINENKNYTQYEKTLLSVN